MIEICTVGGFNEVGKNCTAIKVDDEVIVIDMGLHLEKYINYTEGEEVFDFSAKKLTSIGAVPDLSLIKDWIKDVKAIIPTHAHLDHVGAIPFISNKFNADIICTPFTKAVVEAILKDEKIKLKNDIKSLSPNSKMKISSKIKIEFINMTHSIPQTIMLLIDTPYGKILYANDFKFDNDPVLGKKPNFERLKKLKDENVICMIVDAIYSGSAKKTPSEVVAKEMLKDVMLGTESKGNAVIVTTFSSHLARLKSIVEFGKKLKRKIIFCGRSLNKYVTAGEEVKIINFTKDVELLRYKNQIKKRLKKIQKKKDKHLIVCTGHQGEPKAILPSIVKKSLPFKLDKGDHVIFSCGTIPSPVNIKNRDELEERLKSYGVRIFKDIHVSGHAAREDHRDLIEMVEPKHIIPAHGDLDLVSPMAELAEELGYELGENIHLVRDGQRIKLK